MAKLGKRTRAAREAAAGKDNLSVEDAVALVKGNATAKFDETVEIAMCLGVDPRHADQMVRGVVSLPNSSLNYETRVGVSGSQVDPACAVKSNVQSLTFPIVCKGKFSDDPAGFGVLVVCMVDVLVGVTRLDSWAALSMVLGL